MKLLPNLFFSVVALLLSGSGWVSAQNAAYEAGLRVRYIDTPRQFSIIGVTEFTKVVIGTYDDGSDITISESNFQWDRRLEELLKESVGKPPEHGELRYDPTWDRIEVLSDFVYYEKVLTLLKTRFPDSFTGLAMTAEEYRKKYAFPVDPDPGSFEEHPDNRYRVFSRYGLRECDIDGGDLTVLAFYDGATLLRSYSLKQLFPEPGTWEFDKATGVLMWKIFNPKLNGFNGEHFTVLTPSGVRTFNVKTGDPIDQ